MENCSSLDDVIDFGSDFEVENRPMTPPEVIEAAGGAKTNLLPKKSSGRYQQAYDSFQTWKSCKGARSNSERTLMAYFSELEKKFAASTLWSKYSMLKYTLVIHDQIDISTYGLLTAMLKQASKDYVPKQAKTFTEIEMQRFMDTAPDVAWLDVKVVCAFGLSGACRTHELPIIRMQDIARYDDMFYVTVPRTVTKTGKENSFAITGALLDYVRKYESLRPGHATSDRFFLNFQKGKCTVQPIGKSKFYKMPRRVAEFLNLPDPQNYTGHSIRRSSATIYANTGASIEALKRHTGHKSTKVCEMYIDNSMGYKKRTGNAITSSINCSSTSSSMDSFAGAMHGNESESPSESNHFRIATDPRQSDAPLLGMSRSISSNSFGSGLLSPGNGYGMRGNESAGRSESSHFRIATDPRQSDALLGMSRSIASNSFGSGLLAPGNGYGMRGNESAGRSKSSHFRIATDPRQSDALLGMSRSTASSSIGSVHSEKCTDDIDFDGADGEIDGKDTVDSSQNPVYSQLSTQNFDGADGETDGDDTVDNSQNPVCSQLSTQNFVAQMDKRFAFYKCDKLTININK